jgi:hypothetical protein
MSEIDNNNQPDGGAPDEGAVDPVLNVKAEFQRKFDNVSQQLAEQNRRMEEILQGVISANTQRSQPQQPQGKSIKEMMYDDPDAAAAEITNRALAAANQAVEQRVQESQRAQSMVQEVMNNYPEFGVQGSEAAQLAFQKMKSFPKEDQGKPFAVKTAMLEAAAELGLIPAKARKSASQGQDDFSMAGRTSGTGGSRQRSDQKPKVAPETLELAALLGVDVTDKKRLQGLEEASKRTKWSKYE